MESTRSGKARAALLEVEQFLSRDEAEFLVDFLRKTLDARDAQGAAN